MKDSINIEGRTLISSRRAAEITKYANDYIGQLCRSGKIKARMVGRSWFVDEKSLLEHKTHAELLSRENGQRQLGHSNFSGVSGNGSAGNIGPTFVTSPIASTVVPKVVPLLKYSSDERPLLPIITKSAPIGDKLHQAVTREQSRDFADTFPRDDRARGDLSRGKVVGEVGETVSGFGKKSNVLDLSEAGRIARANVARVVKSSYTDLSSFVLRPESLVVIAMIFTFIGFASLNSALISSFRNHPLVSRLATLESDATSWATEPFIALGRDAQIMSSPITNGVRSLTTISGSAVSSVFYTIRDGFTSATSAVNKVTNGVMNDSPLAQSNESRLDSTSNSGSLSITASIWNSITSSWNTLTGIVRESTREFLGIRDYNLPGVATTTVTVLANTPRSYSTGTSTTIVQRIVEQPRTTIINQLDPTLLARIITVEQAIANNNLHDYRQTNVVYDSIGRSVSDTARNITEGGTLNDSTLNDPTINNPSITNPSISNGTIMNSAITNSTFSGSTGSFQDLTYVNATSTNATSTNLFATNSIFTNILSYTSPIAPYFTATSSTASVFPYASTTAITSSGSAYFATLGGNVGIGTTSPVATLDIVQSGNGTQVIRARRFTDNSPSGDFINFTSADGATSVYRVDNSGNVYQGGVINSGSIAITSITAPQLRVQYNSSNENTVGVSATGVTSYGFNGTTPTASWNPASNSLNTFSFNDATSNSVLSVDTLNHRVGIGTTSPSTTFAVQGNSYVSGSSFFGGAITGTSTLNVEGATTLASTLDVTGATVLSSSLNVTGVTTLASSLNGPLQANAGIVSATTSIGVLYGGTGLTSLASGSLTYGSGGNTLSVLPISTDGKILTLAGGVPSWTATTTFSSPLNYSGGNVALGYDSTLTTSGPNLSLNMANQNSWTALQSFANASTTQLTLQGRLYDGSDLSGTPGHVLMSTNSGVQWVASSTLANIAGTLAVSSGGTGQNSFTSGQLLYGAGSGALQSVSTTTPTGTYPLQISGTGALVGGGATFSLAFGTTTSNTWDGTQTFDNATLTNSTFTNAPTLSGITSTGLAVNSSGVIYGAATTTAGTGLSYSGNAFNVNTSQNITTLSNLTSNGAVLTSGGVGTLGVYTGTSCTNQFIRSLDGSLVSTCATVANTDLANSTIGLTSSGSITVGSSPISLGGTSALNLNMANPNTWTAKQAFSYASTTQLTLGGQLYDVNNSNGTAGYVLMSQGGILAPQWVATTTLGNISGTLAVTSGGTGQTSFTSGNLLYGAGTGALQSVATTTIAVGTGISVTSGSLGYQIGGSNVTIGIANNALTLAQLPQISAGYILGNNTGATASVTSFATSSLFSWNGTGLVVRDTSPSFTTPALGTPSALVGTNITGTGANFTAGNVTTNANLTGPITSVGNATTITNNSVTGAMIALGSDATGDLMYYDGTDYVRRAIGTGGFVLTSSGGIPAWSATSTIGIQGRGNGVANQIAYFSDANTITSSGSYLWNDTTKLLTVTGNASTTQLTTTGNTYLSTTGGNVGIGLTAPGEKLSVSGNVMIGDSTWSALTTTGDLAIQGNVGIGTTSPTSKLSVQGAGYISSNLFVGGAITGTSTLAISGTGDSYILGNVGIGTTTPVANLGIQGSIGVNASQLYLAADGNVGIGTASPTAKLDIVSPNTPLFVKSTTVNSGIVYFYNSVNSVVARIADTSGAGELILRNIGVDSVKIDALGDSYLNGGNVGIGTTSPLAKLVVKQSSGDSYLNSLHLQRNGTLDTFALVTGADNSLYFGYANNASGANANSDFTAPLILTSGGSATMLGNLTVSGTGNTTIAGNVGIGLTSPGEKLSVSGNVMIGDSTWSALTTTGDLAIQGNVGIGTTSPVANLGIQGSIGVNASQLYLAANGNVGIGEVVPTSKLSIMGIDDNQVVGAGTSGSLEIINQYGANYGRLSELNFGAAGSGYHMAAISSAYTTWDAAGLSGDLRFSTRTVGGVTLTEKMRISVAGGLSVGNSYVATDAGAGNMIISGNVGIGTTSPSGKLDVYLASSDSTTLPLQIGKGTAGNYVSILNNGNVGIGTTSPSSLLSVQGNSYVSGSSFFGGAITGTSTLAIQGTGNSYILGNVGIGTTSPFTRLSLPSAGNSSGAFLGWDAGTSAFSRRWWIGNDQLINGDFAIQTESSKGLASPDTVRFYIQNNGNVGIGTTSPSSLLSVQGNSYVSGSSFFGGAITGTSTLAIQGTGNSYILGNVGIGTTSPTSKLSVHGGAYVSSDLFVGGAITGTSTLAIQGTGNSYILGNVGIGTTSPQATLEIGSTVSAAERIRFDYNSNVAGYYGSLSHKGLAGKGVNIDSISASNDASASILFRRSVNSGSTITDSMTIDNLGNVGIGTTSPWGKLSITQTGTAGAPAFIVEDSASPDTTPFIIDQTGSVGIGTTSPSAKLQVYDGSAYAPSLTHASNGSFSLQMSGVEMVIGSDINSPYATWLQTRNRTSDNTSYPLSLNPLGGNVGIGTTSPNVLLTIGGANATGAANGLNFSGDTTANLYRSAAGTIKIDGALTVAGGLNVPSLGVTITRGSSAPALMVNQTSTGHIVDFQGNGTVLDVIDNLGNVGIGTTSPSGKLSIETNGNDNYMTLNSGANRENGFIFKDDGANRWEVYQQTIAGTADNFHFYNYRLGSDVMTLKSSGNVGIGTTGPNKLLELSKANDTTIRLTSTQNDSLWTDGNVLGGFEIYSNDISGAGGVGIKASIKAISSGNAEFGGYTGLKFSTSGSDGNEVERLRITNGGNVGIGTTTPDTLLNVYKAYSGDIDLLKLENHNIMDSTRSGRVVFTGFYGNLAGIKFSALGGGAGANDGVLTFQTGTDTVLSDKMVINNLGNVGIGTTSPSGKLDVYLASSDSTTLPLQIGKGTAGNYVSILNNGNVGIGLTAPGEKLSVSGNVMIGDSTWSALTTTGDLAIQGNVGIGTTSPSRLLSVQGAGYISSNLFVGGAITGTSTLAISGTGDSYILGNVGIGTTTPMSKLNVYNGAGGGSVPVSTDIISMENNGAAYLNLITPSANQGGILFSDNNRNTGSIIYDHSDNSMRFRVATDEMVRITSTGNVGIGTTSPEASLNVVSGNNIYRQLVLKNIDHSQRLSLGAVADSVGSYIANNAYYTTSGNFKPSYASASGIKFGNDGSTQFFNDTGKTIGTDYVPTARMTILNAGNVGIGTTSPTSKLSVQGAGYISSNLFVGGAITGTSTLAISGTGDSYILGNVGIGTTSPLYKLAIQNTSEGNTFQIYDTDGNCLLDPDSGGITTTCSSDARLKTDIVNAGSVLSYLTNIPIKDYTVIASGDKRTGVIAQELLTTYPELVKMGPDGLYGVSEVSSWKLIKGIQELDTKIVNLASTTISSLADTNTKVATTTDQMSIAMTSIQTLTDSIAELDTKYNLLASSTPVIDMEYLATTTADTLSKSSSFIAIIAEAVKNLFQSAGELVMSKISGTLATFDTMISGRMEAQTAAVQTLCIGNTCVTEAQLRELLAKEGVAAVASPTATPTPLPSESPTPTPTPTSTPEVTPTPISAGQDSTSGNVGTGAPSPSESPTPTPEVSPTPTPSISPEITPTPTPEVTPTPTPDLSITPTPTPAPSPSESPTPTPTPEITPTPLP